MSGTYITYPDASGGSTSVGSYVNLAAFPSPPPTGMYLAVAEDTDIVYVYDTNSSTWLPIGGPSVPLTAGALDGAAKNAMAITIGSNTIFLQSADASFPGVVTTGAQSFAGAKVFGSAPQFTSLTSNLPAVLGSGSLLSSRSLLFGSPDVIGSVSLVNQVVGNLPVSQTSGSISLVNQVSGQLPITQTSGSVSLVNKVFGNLPLSQTSGSISLVNQVSGSLPLAQTTGSISLVNQVVGNLPLSQTSGSISLTNQVVGIIPQGNIPTTLNIGSVSMTQTAAGATYTVSWPAAQGASSTVPQNDGSGNLTWAAALTNPMTTAGDIIVGSGTGIVTRLALGAENTSLKSTVSGVGKHAWDYPDGPVANKTANYVIGSSDTTLICSSSTFTLTLPPPVSLVGQKFRVQKIDSNILGPTVISTTASQSISIGSAGLVITSIQLNGLGDYAELIAISSGAYALMGSRLTTYANFNTTAAYGGTNTKIRAWATTVANFGNAFTAVSGSGSAGCSVTINLAGIYSFTYTDTFLADEALGLSLNSTELTTDVTAVITADVLGLAFTVAANEANSFTWTGYLKAGDIMRPHTRAGAASITPTRGHFTASRIN